MAKLRLEDRSIDLVVGTVHADGEVIDALSVRPHELLRLLVARPGEVLTRDEILEAVWGHVEAASDDSVNVAVSQLRKALGDTERPHRLLQTLPRRGYVWSGPLPEPTAEQNVESAVEPVSPSPQPEPERQAAGEPGRPAPAKRPALALLALIVAGVAAAAVLYFNPGKQDTSPPTKGKQPFVAVLPFEDFSTAGDQRPFADGLTDSVLHALAQIPDMTVVARTSTYAFRNSGATIAEIADTLGVDTLLEGSIQRTGDTIRVVAQLIDVEDQKHLWSKTFDRKIGDDLAIQDDIAAAVANEMRLTLQPQTNRSPLSLDAYEQLAMARALLDLGTVEGARTASASIADVVAKTPDSVEALVLLADAELSLARLTSAAPEAARLRARQLLDRATAVEPNSPDVARARGDLAVFDRRDDDAERFYRQAIDFSPSYAEAHARYGRLLFRDDQYDRALEHLSIAKSLDPLNDEVNQWFIEATWADGRSEEALGRLRDQIERNPDYPPYHSLLGRFLNQLGRLGEAMIHVQEQWALDPDNPFRQARVCEFYVQLADDRSAERCTDDLETRFSAPVKVLYLRQQIAGFRGHMEEQLRLMTLFHESNPSRLNAIILAMSLAREGDCQSAIETLKAAMPGLFVAQPLVTLSTATAAQVAVHCLRQVNRPSEAEPLLEAVEHVLTRNRTKPGPRLIAGPEVVQLKVLLGDYEGALMELEQLVDGGWRYYWWVTKTNAILQPIADSPRFWSLMTRLEENVASERNWFEQHKRIPMPWDEKAESEPP